jgi:hypothetical protein
MYTSMMRKALFGSGDTATLSLDFSAGSLPTAVTFTRADSTARATYIDASGYVKTVAAAGDARFDYTGGVAKGLLIEAAATNLARWSENCGNTANGWWSLTGAGSTLNSQTKTSPANTSTASEISFGTSTNSNTYVYVGTSALTYTGSIYLRLVSGNPAINIRVYNSTTGIATLTPITVTSTWARYSVSFTGGASFVEFGIQSPHATTVVVDVWGAQVELGTQASSFIGNAASQLTRLADDAVIRSTAWTSLYAQPGAMVVEFYRGAYGAGDRSIMSTDTTAALHWHLKQANASATAQIAFSSGSAVTQTGLVSGLNKVALAWNAPTPTASFDLCVNGATPTFGGSNVGTTLSTWLTLGSQSTTGVSGTGVWDGYLNNSIKSVKYYSALTYAEMQAKTT